MHRLTHPWREQAGFSRAICSSTVVVTVMSREALASVSELKQESPCDNVVLEYGLALSLAEMKGVAIFPLFVGDKSKNDDAGLGEQIKGLKEQMKTQDASEENDRKALLTNLKKKVQHPIDYCRSSCLPWCTHGGHLTVCACVFCVWLDTVGCPDRPPVCLPGRSVHALLQVRLSPHVPRHPGAKNRRQVRRIYQRGESSPLAG